MVMSRCCSDTSTQRSVLPPAGEGVIVESPSSSGADVAVPAGLRKEARAERRMLAVVWYLVMDINARTVSMLHCTCVYGWPDVACLLERTVACTDTGCTMGTVCST